MKQSIIVALYLLAFCLVPSTAFVGPRRRYHATVTSTQQKIPFNSPVLEIRGGTGPETASSLKLADYSEAAKALFTNLIGPASMLTGGLVPIGFMASLPPHDGKNWKKKARCLYMVLSVFSLVNELTAIMYATVASNKLTEIASAPAQSAFALIRRDYELSWVATNVHFMLGLLGFCSLIMLRALTIFPENLNTAVAGLGLSALLGMVSVVNVGVAQGDGQGRALGGNILSLGIQYVRLLFRSFAVNKNVLGITSFALFIFFSVRVLQSLMKSESQ